MRLLAILLFMSAAAASPLHRRNLAQGPAVEPAATSFAAGHQCRAGVWLFTVAPALYLAGPNASDPNQYAGFETCVLRALESAAGLDCVLVGLPSLDDRISALRNGSVDLVLSLFSATEPRAQLVEFVKPYYYSAGAALYAVRGQLPGVTRWEELRGKPVAVNEGYCALDHLRQLGAELVIVSAQTGEKMRAVHDGRAIAFIDDSVRLPARSTNFAIVRSIPPLDPTPYAVAVARGNEALKQRLSAALKQLAAGGQGSQLISCEKQYFGAAGAPPNADLAQLVETGSGPLEG